MSYPKVPQPYPNCTPDICQDTVGINVVHEQQLKVVQENDYSASTQQHACCISVADAC